MIRAIALILGLFMLTSCAEGSRTEEPGVPVGAGESFVSSGFTYEAIWQAAQQSLSPEFVVVKADRLKGEITARKPAAKKAREEQVGIYVAPLGKGSGSGYRVKVITLKGAPKGKNWEEILVERMRGKLG